MRRQTEETEPLTVRLPVPLMAKLRERSTAEGRNLNILVREALETFWFFSLTPGMRAEFETEEKEREQPRQDFIHSIFDAHYRELILAGAKPKKR